LGYKAEVSEHAAREAIAIKPRYLKRCIDDP